MIELRRRPAELRRERPNAKRLEEITNGLKEKVRSQYNLQFSDTDHLRTPTDCLPSLAFTGSIDALSVLT